MMRKLDQLAWRQLESRPVPRGELRDHFGLSKSGRPASFAELEQVLRAGADLTIAWCEFLDEFYLFRRVQFFEEPPSDYFDRRTRAFFAATVEYLCRRFNLSIPAWTEEPDYFLQDFWQKSHEDVRNPAFARRNIGYDPDHNLVRL